MSKWRYSTSRGDYRCCSFTTHRMNPGANSKWEPLEMSRVQHRCHWIRNKISGKPRRISFLNSETKGGFVETQNQLWTFSLDFMVAEIILGWAVFGCCDIIANKSSAMNVVANQFIYHAKLTTPKYTSKSRRVFFVGCLSRPSKQLVYVLSPNCSILTIFGVVFYLLSHRFRTKYRYFSDKVMQVLAGFEPATSGVFTEVLIQLLSSSSMNAFRVPTEFHFPPIILYIINPISYT